MNKPAEKTSLLKRAVTPPFTIDRKSLRSYSVWSYTSIFGFIAHICMMTLFFILDLKILVYFNIFSLAIWTASYFVNRKGFVFTAFIMGYIEVLANQCLCVYTLGWGPGFQYYYLVLPLGGFLAPHGKKFFKSILSAVGIIGFILLNYYCQETEPLYKLSPYIIDLMAKAPEVQQAARLYLPWMVAAPVLGLASYMLDGIFIGATRTRDMRNMMALSLCIYVLSVLLLVPSHGNHGLWMALMVSFAARALTLGLRYPALEAAAAR